MVPVKALVYSRVSTDAQERDGVEVAEAGAGCSQVERYPRRIALADVFSDVLRLFQVTDHLAPLSPCGTKQTKVTNEMGLSFV
jgi:hypothetical protein